MAQRIEGPYDFSKYGFTKYADGATWILTKGEDYHVGGTSVLANARRWAKDEGLDIEYKLIPAEGRNSEQIALRFRRAGQLRAVTG